jgi:hypothetical protein
MRVHEVILKRFDKPDEVRLFEKGRFELVNIGGMTIVRASYEPGWRSSVRVGAAQGLKRCAVEHVGWSSQDAPQQQWMMVASLK